ncbi:MAG TPA: TIGR02147 family protein [bacterium]|nr:TIGR02147 family protein [bacterium]
MFTPLRSSSFVGQACSRGGIMDVLQILDYSDYRVFLKELYERRKQISGKYSYRQYADDLGFSASNYLHLVVAGQRNLSPSAAAKIMVHFKWTAQQKKYFRALVLYNQSTKADEQEACFRALEKILGKKRVMIGPDQAAYFSRWYLPVLKEMVALKNFVPHLNWISKTLFPCVDEPLVKEGLAILERLKMIKRVKDRWVQEAEHLTTPLQINSSMVHGYHREMLKLSANALNMDSAHRDISTMTMSLSQRQFDWLKQRVIDFRDEVQQELQGMRDEQTLVAQLNIQLFPVTRT